MITPVINISSQQSSKLNDVWESIPDNDFATDLFRLIEWEKVFPDGSGINLSLCSKCNAIDGTRLFDSKCDVMRLQQNSQACHLCELLFKALDKVNIKPPRAITLRQNGAVIGVEAGPNLLSVYVEPRAGM